MPDVSPPDELRRAAAYLRSTGGTADALVAPVFADLVAAVLDLFADTTFDMAGECVGVCEWHQPGGHTHPALILARAINTKAEETK